MQSHPFLVSNIFDVLVIFSQINQSINFKICIQKLYRLLVKTRSVPSLIFDWVALFLTKSLILDLCRSTEA